MKQGLAKPEQHHAPKDLFCRVALFVTQRLRFSAALFFAKRDGHRAVVLETVVAVPGRVGATATHLNRLRHRVDDVGWIRILVTQSSETTASRGKQAYARSDPGSEMGVAPTSSQLRASAHR